MLRRTTPLFTITALLTAGCLADPAEVPDDEVPDELPLEEGEADGLADDEHDLGDDPVARHHVPPLPPCSEEKRREILSPPVASPPIQDDPESAFAVRVDCSLTLQPGEVVTRRLVFEGPAASGAVLQCAPGAVLDGRPTNPMPVKDIIHIRSLRTIDPATGEPVYQRPEHVTIRYCRIEGAIAIFGMTGGRSRHEAKKLGFGHPVRSSGEDHASSRRAGHTSRARAAAPRHIVLDGLHITAHGRTPLYVSPGVTRLTVNESKFDGWSEGPAIYLDTESGFNELRANVVKVDTQRELLSIDGSESNLIVNNRFSRLEDGGIYLYRNCGEDATVRHTPVRRNRIINNTFHYKNLEVTTPAVWVGHRDGIDKKGYCDHDKDLPFGSSIQDADMAMDNVVMQNQIVLRPVASTIIVSGARSTGNAIKYNYSTTTEQPRPPAGCWVDDLFGLDFLRHGESSSLGIGPRGEPRCIAAAYTCDDGVIRYASADLDCGLQQLAFGCGISGDSNGCTGMARCPAGTGIVAAAAACDLEVGNVTDAELRGVPAGALQVVKPSDQVSAGRCHIDGTVISEGRAPLPSFLGRVQLGFGCREHDNNGGDCHIRGDLWCR